MINCHTMNCVELCFELHGVMFLPRLVFSCHKIMFFLLCCIMSFEWCCVVLCCDVCWRVAPSAGITLWCAIVIWCLYCNASYFFDYIFLFLCLLSFNLCLFFLFSNDLFCWLAVYKFCNILLNVRMYSMCNLIFYFIVTRLVPQHGHKVNCCHVLNVLVSYEIIERYDYFSFLS